MPYIECHSDRPYEAAKRTLIRDIVQSLTNPSDSIEDHQCSFVEHPAATWSISGRIHGEEPNRSRKKHAPELGQS